MHRAAIAPTAPLRIQLPVSRSVAAGPILAFFIPLRACLFPSSASLFVSRGRHALLSGRGDMRVTHKVLAQRRQRHYVTHLYTHIPLCHTPILPTLRMLTF